MRSAAPDDTHETHNSAGAEKSALVATVRRLNGDLAKTDSLKLSLMQTLSQGVTSTSSACVPPLPTAASNVLCTSHGQGESDVAFRSVYLWLPRMSRLCVNPHTLSLSICVTQGDSGPVRPLLDSLTRSVRLGGGGSHVCPHVRFCYRFCATLFVQF